MSHASQASDLASPQHLAASKQKLQPPPIPTPNLAMDSLPFNVAALDAYTSPPTNYLGATLFLSYIASALYLSTTITLDLWKQYNATLAAPSKDATVSTNRAARTRHVKIYAFLASISFATLSYHMLSFLLASFAAWDGTARFEWQRASAGALGRWMLETALFEDFAKELVVDGASAICTQASVLVIWFWGIWVAQKGGFFMSTFLPHRGQMDENSSKHQN
jgi:hypothetical protein